MRSVARARGFLAGVVGCVVAPASAWAAGGEGGADLIWSVVNLLLLLGVLVGFARKPVRAWFRERRDRIRLELDSAAKLRQEAEDRYARWQRQLLDLDTQLASIRATSRERAAAERDRILADARASAERIKRDARVAVEHEVRRAREQLRREASDLSIQLATEILNGQVTDADRKRLVDEFIAKVEQRAPNGSGS